MAGTITVSENMTLSIHKRIALKLMHSFQRSSVKLSMTNNFKKLNRHGAVYINSSPSKRHLIH